jgi:hypothetical protein
LVTAASSACDGKFSAPYCGSIVKDCELTLEQHVIIIIIIIIIIILVSESNNPSISLGTAIGYELDERELGVRVQVGSTIFTSRYRPDRLWGPPNLISNGYHVLLHRT